MRFLITLLVLTCVSLLFNVTVHSSKLLDSEIIRRGCETFTRGVFADRDPFNEATSRGGRLFQFTYKPNGTQADQFLDVADPRIHQSADALIQSVSELQQYSHTTFNVHFMNFFDEGLSPQSFEVKDLFFHKSFTYVYANSSEYKYERDQIEQGKNVLYKFQYTFDEYFLKLNESVYALSPELKTDLALANFTKVSEHASYLVAKYGSLFLKEAILGTSQTHNEYVPKRFFDLMDDIDRWNAPIYLSGRNNEIGNTWKWSMGNKTEMTFHRRTSLSNRGFSGLSLMKPLPEWDLREFLEASNRPEMIYLSFAPLSDLILGDATLKQEVALAVRSQLFRSAALNFLDGSELLAQGNQNYGVLYFSGLDEYVKQTRKQMEQFVAFKASSLADRSISPFLKMDVIARAFDLSTNKKLNIWKYFSSDQVGKSITMVKKCFKVLNLSMTEELIQSMKAIPEAEDKLKAKANNLFVSWEESNASINDKFTKLDEEGRKFIYKKAEMDSLFLKYANFNFEELVHQCEKVK